MIIAQYVVELRREACRLPNWIQLAAIQISPPRPRRYARLSSPAYFVGKGFAAPDKSNGWRPLRVGTSRRVATQTCTYDGTGGHPSAL